MRKKIVSLLLALCLVLALTACGGPKITSADFEGVWKAQVDVTKEVSSAYSQEELNEALEGIDSSAYLNVNDLKIPPLTIVMTLNSDKTFTMALDEGSAQIIADAVAAWFAGADFEGMFTEVLTKEGEEYGFSLDEMMEMLGAESVTDMIEMMFEMPLDDFVKELTGEITEDVDEFDLDEFSESGTWEFATDKVTLTASGKTDELTFDKDAFTLTETVADYGTVIFSR